MANLPSILNKDRKYTDTQLKFLANMCDPAYGADVKACLEDAGYHETSYAGALKTLENEIIDISRTKLVTALPKAVDSLIGGMDKELGTNQMKAISEVMDRGGLNKKVESTVNHNIQHAIVILPAKEGTIIDG